MTSRPAAAILLAWCVAGCAGPVSMWYRADAEPTAPTNQLINCRVSAAQRVPVNPQLAQNPAFVTPLTTSCYQGRYATQCVQSGGDVIGGEVYSYDANASLRADVIGQCMAQAGYELVTLRQCKSKEIAAGLPRYRVLPQISANSCLAHVPGTADRFVIVTPPI